MAFQVILDRPDVYRILLEPRAEGCYVNAFQTAGDKWPYNDMLQDDVNMAMHDCEQRFGVPKEDWVVVPNEPIHFDSTEDQEPAFPVVRDPDGRIVER